MVKSKVKIEVFRDSTGAFFIIENGKRRKIGIRELKRLREKEKAGEKAEQLERLRAIGGEY